jgi:hypothetical protein
VRRWYRGSHETARNDFPLRKRGIQGDFIVLANPPTPFAKGGLKMGTLHAAIRQLSTAVADLLVLKEQESLFFGTTNPEEP